MGTQLVMANVVIGKANGIAKPLPKLQSDSRMLGRWGRGKGF